MSKREGEVVVTHQLEAQGQQGGQSTRRLSSCMVATREYRTMRRHLHWTAFPKPTEVHSCIQDLIHRVSVSAREAQCALSPVTNK